MKTNSASTSLHEAGGCFTSVLRRFLCNNLTQTRVEEEEEDEKHNGLEVSEKIIKNSPVSPSIVARLMGLESMPVHPYPQQDCMRRSRSVSSIESWPVSLAEERSRNHESSPKIKHSLSFREIPTFLRIENEDFLLLSFAHDEDDECGEVFAIATEKTRPSYSVSKQFIKENLSRKITDCRVERRKKRNSESFKESLSSFSSAERKLQTSRELKPAKQKERRYQKNSSASSVHVRSKVDFECNSENASPDSVLDSTFDMDEICSNKLNSSVASEKKKLNSRKKLSPELETVSWSSPKTEFIIERVVKSPEPVEAMKAVEQALRFNKENKNQKQERTGKYFFSVSSSYGFELAELEVEKMKNETWSEESGEIAAAVGVEVLDLLLNEAVAEFSSVFFFCNFSNCEFPSTNQATM